MPSAISGCLNAALYPRTTASTNSWCEYAATIVVAPRQLSNIARLALETVRNDDSLPTTIQRDRKRSFSGNYNSFAARLLNWINPITICILQLKRLALSFNKSTLGRNREWFV
jgi:hypothetical protein